MKSYNSHHSNALCSLLWPFCHLLLGIANAQVNTGSNGSDGAFHPTTNTVVDMTDHPTGVYQFTSVNIPANVKVTFIPNLNNTPVVWLIQSNCVIDGVVDLSGKPADGGIAGEGGPGGWRGGNGGSSASAGEGPGGGFPGFSGGNASYGTKGDFITPSGWPTGGASGANYGNVYIHPLIGGSGGGGSDHWGFGGSGGGGAMVIAAATTIDIVGTVTASGAANNGGASSGGAVRLIAAQIKGGGQIIASGGYYYGTGYGGLGRVRFDTFENNFGGLISGMFTSGTQFIILPGTEAPPQLKIASIGGLPVSASPGSVLAAPDAVIPAQQINPIPIVVSCGNLPLNSTITLTVKPVNGPALNAVGQNSSGNQAFSTATIFLNIPRGGGLIYATAAIGN